LPDRAEVDAYATMEPAKNVGGDLYDAFFTAPDRLFVAVGDVSGKGVPAALFMARTITQLRMEAVRRRSPSAILEAVNRALCEGNDAGMFVTLFCGVLETTTGQFSFANAGHNPPLFLGTGGGAEFMQVKKGLVAGIIETSRYPAGVRQLAPGDCILMYTDGVTEAMNTRDELYSDARLLATAGAISPAEPRSLVEGVRTTIAAFAQGAAQADDITMLAMRYRGAAAHAAPAISEHDITE
jgi:sigma-B regulation protein RsbU (phosphoserine phosphatase)